MRTTSPCIAIVGPTASGKSDLALELAERFQAEIVNFDSVQVYRGFDIGTAKTPDTERRGIPHHLVDHVAPAGAYSAGDYARDARSVLQQLRNRGTLPALVGGTGLYLEALVKGLFRGPKRDPVLRKRLHRTAETRPAGHLWRVLERLDRKAASSIHPHDVPKLVRAIEVSLIASRPITEQWQETVEPLQGFRMLTLGLDPPRESLYARINSRARKMFAAGLVEEVQGLLQCGVPRSARPFGALGYAQCVRYLDGECSHEEAIESTAVQTRRYAKRQLTWFRHRTPGIRWVQDFGDAPEAIAQAADLVDGWLKSEVDADGEGAEPSGPCDVERPF